MQLNSDVLNKVTYLVGSVDIVAQLSKTPAKSLFDDSIVEFLNEVSKILMKDLHLNGLTMDLNLELHMSCVVFKLA